MVHEEIRGKSILHVNIETEDCQKIKNQDYLNENDSEIEYQTW